MKLWVEYEKTLKENPNANRKGDEQQRIRRKQYTKDFKKEEKRKRGEQQTKHKRNARKKFSIQRHF